MQVISMDFIQGLPMTHYGHNAIIVVIDKLTKVAHFIKINLIDDAPIENNFMKEIFRLHGILEKIILDRDVRFTSKFWITLQLDLGTQLNFSSTHHPETNKKTKIDN